MPPILIEKKLNEALPLRFGEWVQCKVIGVVCDETTHEVLGNALMQSMASSYTLVPLILGKKPKPTLENASRIQAELAEVEAIASVGSGTITDLCKYASAQMNVPLIACATAPSMNGYLSSTASLMDGAHKRSHQAQQPVALVADLDVLTHAPRRLIRAGVGDVMCRSTVQADWLLSHRLLGTPYDASLFDKWVPLEAELIAQSIRLTEKDPTFIKLLMRMLLLSGEAMHVAGSSAPASQGEHMIAHLFELLYGHEQAIESFHGEQIAVTTVTMSRIQDKVLLRLPTIKPSREKPEQFSRLFGKDHAEGLYSLYRKKALSEARALEIASRLEREWPTIKEEMDTIRIKTTVLENALKKANCPVSYCDIGWHKDRYEHAVTHAHLTRDRFTFLDLMAMDVGMRVMG